MCNSWSTVLAVFYNTGCSPTQNQFPFRNDLVFMMTMCNFYLLDRGQSAATKCLKLFILSDSSKNNGQLTVGQCLRPGWATRYQPCCFCGKEKNLPHSGCPLLCSNDSSLPLSFFLRKKHTYTQAMGTSLQRGSLKENNADLSSSHRGSTGNNKSGCVLCWESELSIWCQQRLNSNCKRHNKTFIV